jgi:hypothetical protein
MSGLLLRLGESIHPIPTSLALCLSPRAAFLVFLFTSILVQVVLVWPRRCLAGPWFAISCSSVVRNV